MNLILMYKGKVVLQIQVKDTTEYTIQKLITAYQSANGTWDRYYNVYSSRLGHRLPKQQSVGYLGLQDNDILELLITTEPSLTTDSPDAPLREQGPSTPRFAGKKKSSKKGMKKSSKTCCSPKRKRVIRKTK